MVSLTNVFDLTGRVAVITGGGGFLGRYHAEAIAEAGATPILADLRGDRAEEAAAFISQKCHVKAMGMQVDITKKIEVQRLFANVLEKYGRTDILINNAAYDPKLTENTDTAWTRFENY